MNKDMKVIAQYIVKYPTSDTYDQISKLYQTTDIKLSECKLWMNLYS